MRDIRLREVSMLEVAKGKYAEEKFSHATIAGKEESDY